MNFGTFYSLRSVVLPDESQGTDYCLELRDANESILGDRCFDFSYTEPESGQPMDSDAFVTTLPYPHGTDSIVLIHLVHSRDASHSTAGRHHCFFMILKCG